MNPTETMAAPSGARPAVPLLRAENLAKAFGPTRALRSCSFEVLAGEVHAIVGENGSGKSTLVKILSGVHRADTGVVELSGESLASRRTPRAAQESGIVTVFQEVLVVGSQSVVENVWLGTNGLFRASVGETEKRERARAVLTELLGSAPPLDAPVESLSLSDRQACCIARALVRSPRVLILDESTSALDIATRDRLFGTIRKLCATGSSVIFISHRMGEIDELADHITVLRSGNSVITLSRGEATTDDLVRHMTGNDQLTSGIERSRTTPGEVLLRAEGVQLQPQGRPIDFELRAGELVGLAGLEGHGQDAFLQALRGAGAMAGRVVSQDHQTLSSPRAALNARVAYVPRDRRDESLFPSLSITENFAAPTFGDDRQAGLISWRGGARRLADYVKQLAIRIGNPRQPIVVLSGGNQQKVIVARWLAAKPRVLLLNDPTRGVDLGAKRDLYRLLEGLASEGIAIVMLSTELDEHVELMDRVLVFREGSVGAELDRDHLSRSALVANFFGRSGDDDGAH